MITQLAKKVVENATAMTVGGVAVVLLGAAGGGYTLVGTESSEPKASKSAKATKSPKAEKSAKPEKSEKPEGVRPTDTHGYCVSQVAKTAPTTHTGTGKDKVTHGTRVREAAHACGKDGKLGKADKHGKAHGRGHGKGRPAGVPAPR